MSIKVLDVEEGKMIISMENVISRSSSNSVVSCCVHLEKHESTSPSL